MMETMKNKKNIVGNVVWAVAFGLVGLLVIPIVRYIDNLAKRYPKVFKCITVIMFAVACVCVFLWDQKYKIGLLLLFMLICLNGFQSDDNQ